jgi:Beta-galactosidase
MKRHITAIISVLLLGLCIINCQGAIGQLPTCTSQCSGKCGGPDPGCLGQNCPNTCDANQTCDATTNYTECKSCTAGCGGDFSADTFLAWEGGPAYYAQWSHGPSSSPDYFPLSVWLQDPSNAARYKAIGINLFIGLWEGPTAGQLSTLTTSQMPVFCDQNDIGLSNANNGIIKGWLQQDEPDNAQPLAGGGYGPPVDPSVIVHRYNTMKAADSTRPVQLNLGQGVAWDGWWGRGTGTNHPEDYADYANGGDILSYDIYPMNLDPSQSSTFQTELEKVSQSLWYVAYGIDRLRQWSDYKKPVWMALETTNIGGDSPHPPTPATTTSEVWMSIIHGARGIMYFCHEWYSNGQLKSETGLLDDAAMSAAVKDVNAQIISLAPVINTPSVGNGVTTTSSTTAVPVDTMLKRYNEYTYLFAVSMRPGATTATFTLRDFPANASAEVVGESRSIQVTGGVFQDAFADYGVHIYKIK